MAVKTYFARVEKRSSLREEEAPESIHAGGSMESPIRWDYSVHIPWTILNIHFSMAKYLLLRWISEVFFHKSYVNYSDTLHEIYKRSFLLQEEAPESIHAGDSMESPIRWDYSVHIPWTILNIHFSMAKYISLRWITEVFFHKSYINYSDTSQEIYESTIRIRTVCRGA